MTSSATSRLAVAAAAGAGAVVLAVVLAQQRQRRREQRNNDEASTTVTTSSVARSRSVPVSQVVVVPDHNISAIHQRVMFAGRITIAHGSVTGTSSKLAAQLAAAISQQSSSHHVQVGHVQDWDWWDELLNQDDDDNDKTVTANIPILILILPTYTDGTWPPGTTVLHDALHDLRHDWRVEKQCLRQQLQIAVLGLGSSEYDDMGQPAKQALRMLTQLGAAPLVPLGVGDDAVSDHVQRTFADWQAQLLSKLGSTKGCSCSGNDGAAKTEGCCQAPSSVLSNPQENSEEEHGDDSEPDSDNDVAGEPDVMDLEDMGDAMLAAPTQDDDENNDGGTLREMVTPSQAAALKKEGYRLIGTHSAVKLCRWTKHQLRGRGGCYKHTFYGITSYQCMEATPSLACANKCVFCWRHHKNPVGKTWKWKMDDPVTIVQQAVQEHVKMIKETKGIPGVQMQRWHEAHTVRHCALSLVGEPIMYPRINELLGELHQRSISTFLVTNGQHPVAIESLIPITQLYVSVDAPTKKSLIEIDRPLFRDAWDRLRQSLSLLKSKGQRTVARLTVVKGWNSDEVSGYARLIVLGHVSLVEIKGVTFCGKSDASNLNMSNTPFHHEVVELSQTLKFELDRLRQQNSTLPEYDLCCEHKHSCSVLLARVDQFADVHPASGRRRWRTWIDYDKFQELAARHVTDPSFSFTVQDYTAPTPDWALFGAEEEGFDPTDTRHRRKQKIPKYTQFDEHGIPTHDHHGAIIDRAEREKLRQLMLERRRQIGDGTVVTERKDGAKDVQDASLLFRGLTVTQ